MTSSTLTPPVRSGHRPPVKATTSPARRRWERDRLDNIFRRILGWSLLGSLLVHLLILVISPAFIRVGAPPGDTDTPFEPATAVGLRMVDPSLIPSARAVPSSAAPVEEAVASLPVPGARSPSAITPPRAVPPASRPATPGQVETPTARENPLRPGLRDPRLWVAPRELPPEREPTQEELHERYMAHLKGRLDAWNDSIAGEADRARRATDWTVTDKNGGRWGVSPEGIHLGGVTLPPTTFQPGGGDPDKRARWEEQERQRKEIERHQADRDRRRAQEEANRATRERRDAERRP